MDRNANEVGLTLIKVDKITFKKKYRNFKEGESINFSSPITFLVGKNGSGKSTILDCLRTFFKIKDDTYYKDDNSYQHIEVEKNSNDFKVYYFDFHASDKKFASTFGDNISAQIQAMKQSSGNGTFIQFAALKINEAKNSLVILDEPCRGASPYLQEMFKIFLERLVLKGNQCIISTHSERIMDCEFSKIYSCEHKQFFDTADSFLNEHLKSLPKINQSKKQKKNG